MVQAGAKGFRGERVTGGECILEGGSIVDVQAGGMVRQYPEALDLYKVRHRSDLHRAAGCNPLPRRGPIHPRRGVSGTRGLDHRHDAGLQGLGQVGPCFDHGGQVGVIVGGGRYFANAGSATGSAQTPDRVGNSRVET
jgi:hypothetical protein